MGWCQAITLGRAALFEVGKKLGEANQAKLGVGKSRKDLIRAAKVLYRVLGIDFRVEWLGETRAVLVVVCVLANDYSELTCLVLSATDEGVIRGMAPNVSMTFRERMTSGCTRYKADILFNQEAR